MSLNKLQIMNSQGNFLGMPFEDISTGFLVKEIEGLDPVKATLTSTPFANLDGAQFQSSRREPRNIVIHLELRPDYALGSVKDLRDRLYDFFMPKSNIRLDLYTLNKFDLNPLTQTQDLTIDATVESLTSALFTKEPTVDVSLMCYDPNFTDPTSVTITGLTGPDPLTLFYEGSVETGVIFHFLPNRSISSFQLLHEYWDAINNQTVVNSITIAIDIVNGDAVTYTSTPEKKGVVLNHSGVVTPILYAMSVPFKWIELQPGYNYIWVQVPGDPVPYEIQYFKKYGGL